MQSATLTKALAAALSVSLVALGLCTYKHFSPTPSVPVSCQPASEEQYLQRDEVKHNGSANVGGMGMFEYQVHEEAPPDLPSRTINVHPNVALWTPHGRLLGSDRGEFGGELVLSRNDNYSEPNSELILRENIEDLFVMPYGILVTAGLSHMGYDRGAIYLLNFVDSQPVTKKLFDLPSAVVSSWHTRDQKLLINTRRGTFLIESPTVIKKIECPGSS